MQPICGPKPINTHYGNGPRLPTAAQCCWVPTGSQPRGCMLRGAASHTLEHEPLYDLSNWERNHRGALGCGADTARALGLNGHSSVITTELSPPSQLPAEYANGGRSQFAIFLHSPRSPPISSTTPPSELDGALTKAFASPAPNPSLKARAMLQLDLALLSIASGWD